MFAGLEPHRKQKIALPPTSPAQVLRWLAWGACVGVFLWFVSLFHLPGQGLTALILFGEREFGRALPEVQALDVYVVPDSHGYDGQYYAQLAMRPDVSDPAVARAMDNLPYRARRMLLSWTAWLLGAGEPARALHVYSVLNVAAWFLLAILLLRWFPLRSWSGFFRWFAVMFSLGLWFSVRGALTDGPSLLLIAAGMALLEGGRRWSAAAVLGIAGLARETNVLAGAALLPREQTGRAWGRAVLQGLVVVAPLLVWLLVLRSVLAGVRGVPADNFSAPFVAYWQEWYDSIAQWQAGRWFDETAAGVFVIVGLTVQALFLALRPAVSQPWWRIGIGYAVLMIVLGAAVWEGYPGAACRVLLPMTLAFNVLVPTGRRWWPILLLGNLMVVPAVLTVPPVMGDVYRIEGAPAGNPDVNRGPQARVQVIFGQHWGPMEQSRYAQERWRWATGSAEVTVRNPHAQPLRAELRFTLRGRDRREVTVQWGDAVVWSGAVDEKPIDVLVSEVELPPGELAWRFATDAPAAPASAEDPRHLAFQLRDVRLTMLGSAE